MTGIPWDDPYLELHAAEHVEPEPNPVCPICGAGMAIKRFEGHWANDGHSITSQVARRRQLAHRSLGLSLHDPPKA